MKISGKLTREFEVVAERGRGDDRTIDLAFASEEPYERWFGVEILDMAPTSVRLDRLKNRAPLLLNHDRDQQIGVVEGVRLGVDRKARATVRFSQSSLAQDVLRDIRDDIRGKVSVGYQIHAMLPESEQSDTPTFRVTDWEPFEISIVSIPADDTVGVGRDHLGRKNM